MNLESTPQHQYPALFQSLRWGNVSVGDFAIADSLPDRSLVQSVNVVPFLGSQCVLVELIDGSLTLPGGTREQGESLFETASRELMEEAGAHIQSVEPLGFWRCHSDDALPWRPFLAHPDFLRLVFIGEVSIVGPPTVPEDGELVARVDILDIPVAIARLRAAGRLDLADLYALAAGIRASRTLDPQGRELFDGAITAP